RQSPRTVADSLVARQHRLGWVEPPSCPRLVESFCQYGERLYHHNVSSGLLSEHGMIAFTRRCRALLAALALGLISWAAPAQEGRRTFYTPSEAGTVHPVLAEHGMVV